MLNIKKALTELSNKLNITTTDYTVTTGTQQYFGVYYANITLTKPNPSMFYVYNVESNRPTYVQRIDNNTLRVNSITAEAVVTVRCIYIPALQGGVISYIIHLTGLLKSFCGGRRWAYAEPQEVADEAVRTGNDKASAHHSNGKARIHRVPKAWRHCVMLVIRRLDESRLASISIDRDDSGGIPATKLCVCWNAKRIRTQNHDCVCGRWTNNSLQPWSRGNVFTQRLILRSLVNGITPAPERGWWCA